jgi:hypothetical protein
LHQKIADCGSFYRPGDHLALCRIGSELIQQSAPAAATHHMDFPQNSPGDTLEFIEPHGVKKREAFEDAASNFPRRLRFGLPRLPAKSLDPPDHVSGWQKSRIVRMDDRSKWLCFIRQSHQLGVIVHGSG